MRSWRCCFISLQLVFTSILQDRDTEAFPGQELYRYHTNWPCEGCTIVHHRDILAIFNQYFARFTLWEIYMHALFKQMGHTDSGPTM